VCGRAATDRLLDEVDSARHIAEAADAVQRFLLARLGEWPRNAFGPAMLQARDQLFRPVRDIAAHFGLGERQLERRVRQSFGVSLRDLRRMTRFGHALARMVSGPLARGDLTRIAHDFGFYDQAHMDREFVDFAGMAPTRLLGATAGEDPAYWVYRFDRRDFGRLFLP
jgi:AraC-like DNA-binding protein